MKCDFLEHRSIEDSIIFNNNPTIEDVKKAEEELKVIICNNRNDEIDEMALSLPKNLKYFISLNDEDVDDEEFKKYVFKEMKEDFLSFLKLTKPIHYKEYDEDVVFNNDITKEDVEKANEEGYTIICNGPTDEILDMVDGLSWNLKLSVLFYDYPQMTNDDFEKKIKKIMKTKKLSWVRFGVD